MILREMLVDDLDQVMEIEEELFSVPDKRGISDISYEREQDVSCCGRKGRILGYCGLLTVLDEGM